MSAREPDLSLPEGWRATIVDQTFDAITFELRLVLEKRCLTRFRKRPYWKTMESVFVGFWYYNSARVRERMGAWRAAIEGGEL